MHWSVSKSVVNDSRIKSDALRSAQPIEITEIRIHLGQIRWQTEVSGFDDLLLRVITAVLRLRTERTELRSGFDEHLWPFARVQCRKRIFVGAINDADWFVLIRLPNAVEEIIDQRRFQWITQRWFSFVNNRCRWRRCEIEWTTEGVRTRTVCT